MVATKTATMAMLIAALVMAGCSNVLGFKDPSLDKIPGTDAATDAHAGAEIDAAADAAIDAATDATIDAPADTGPAACMPSACPFGCDPNTNACRAEKLWVYLTVGSFAGNRFGGIDAPPDVRATADNLCFATASNSFPMRACSRARTHAVLTVSGSDAIPLMATLYGIPAAVEVHRADDDVLVANTWNDLTDTTKVPRAAAASSTTAPTLADGVVWTGVNGNSTCVNWTSGVATDLGVQGNATLTSSNWMVRASAACNLLERLLCVCWSGGQ